MQSECNFCLQIADIIIEYETVNKKDVKMATPKKKTSKARSAQRRSHDALSIMPCGVCKTCGEKKRPHHVCPACGAK